MIYYSKPVQGKPPCSVVTTLGPNALMLLAQLPYPYRTVGPLIIQPVAPYFHVNLTCHPIPVICWWFTGLKFSITSRGGYRGLLLLTTLYILVVVGAKF